MKYIIEIPDDNYDMYTYNNELRIPWILGENSTKHWLHTGLKVTPYTEPDHKAIEDEVWDFMRFMFQFMDSVDRFKCFGGYVSANSVVRDMTYQEAKARYDTWKKQKEEIRVGDEVFYLDDPDKEKAVVLRRYQPPQYKPLVDILCEGGILIKQVVVENLVRTGRHFDEVEELLNKMKEE